MFNAARFLPLEFDGSQVNAQILYNMKGPTALETQLYFRAMNIMSREVGRECCSSSKTRWIVR